MQVVFAACDEDSKGYLSREDFKVAVVMLFGYKPSKVEVDSVMASLQQKNSGVLLEEFLNLMTTKKSAQLYHSEIRQIFTAFDMQCRGFLTLEDFKKAFDSVAPKLPKRIIIEAFSRDVPTCKLPLLAGAARSLLLLKLQQWGKNSLQTTSAVADCMEVRVTEFPANGSRI
ncbi:EF-hand calcium-binding domain-containing protein 11 isoform X2 [Alligator sinensis]|uniref:EF-hand calcium-binding domain-containing protein 11 isoform X2 n=1 Tax=Alligator sinensis TaxID=38654 RepID=A0A3Q0H0K2_ALLSI|nr:EF-hand calcium-binding domain-containing protein 11 isoform X2 [Alligator sinensis]